MDKKIILGVIALAIVSMTLLLMAPDNSTHTPDTLPWKISHPTPDTSRVLGITLGQTTLDEAAQAFKNEAEVEISLFKPTDGLMGVEAFFEEVNFNGLKAKIVLTINLPPEVLEGMFQRGLRLNSTPSGKRVTLTHDDEMKVRQTPISSMAYLPNVRLEENIFAKRFGEPAERVRETKSGVTHWLYPQQGLDIAVSEKEKPILQYVAPKDFELLRGPLLANGEVVK